MKIKEHKHKKTIESIILHNKFDGKGSKEIQKDLISMLGFEVSRPTIDKYYKECLNGALLDELRQNLLQSIIKTASDKTAGIKPAFCEETAKTTLLDIKETCEENRYNELSGTGGNLLDCYSNVAGLVAGNIKASINGYERLKPEYLRYLKEMRSIFKEAWSYF
tara:strand:+ start:1502 stop:1993 length:492 start_codon:yes stop_codon:yes gene_type:complete